VLLDRIENHQSNNFLAEMAMRTSIALVFAILLTRPVVAWAEDQAVTVGPWTIATSSRGDKFDSCTMSRSTNDLDVSFVRDENGLLLLVGSSKWRLERGKAYPVTLVAGARSIEAKASAETKGVTIAITDRSLNERMRTANILEVIGEGATLKIPLDGSTAALTRLEACFDRNSRQSSDTNPFVAPNRKP
jgi:hypothetical protein